MLVLAATQGSGVPLTLEHHTDGHICLCIWRVLKTLKGLKELGIVLCSLDSHSGHSRGCWAAAGQDRRGLSKELPGFVQHYCPGRCEGCVGHRGQHSLTAFPAPLGSARSPWPAQPTSVCLAPAKRGQKGKEEESIPSFWHSAGCSPSSACLCHCPPRAAARACPPVSPWPSSA